MSEGAFARHREVAAGMIPPLDHAKLEGMTPWQVLVLSMIGSGLKPKEIAYITRREVSTIFDMQRRLMDKLGTDRSAVLVRYAVEAGLVARRETGGWVTPAWVARLQPIGGQLVDSVGRVRQPIGRRVPRRGRARQATTQAPSPPPAPRPDPQGGARPLLEAPAGATGNHATGERAKAPRRPTPPRP